MKMVRKSAATARAAEMDAARAAIRWFQGLGMQDRQAFSAFFLATTHGANCHLTTDDLDDLRAVLGHLIGHPDMLAGMAANVRASRHSLPEPGPDIAGRIGPRTAPSSPRGAGPGGVA